MHLTPSAVSQQIAKLSRELHVPLLEKHGRRVLLTDQAHLLLQHASVIHRQMEQARADLAAHHADHRGYITVGGFSSAIAALIAPALASLARVGPGVRLSVRETEPPDCYTLLEEGGVDIAVTVDYHGNPLGTNPRFYHLLLLFDPFVAALPGDHALAASPAVELADLADSPFVLGVGGLCADLSLAACAMAGFTPQAQHRVSDWGAVLALVATGFGVALIPRLAVGEPPSGVIYRPIACPPVGRAVRAVLRAGSELDPAYALVVDALRDQCAQQDGAAGRVEA